MTLVFDTSILIDLDRKVDSTIEKIKLLSKKYSSIASITFINEFEFHFGINQRNPKNKERALSLLAKFIVLHTTKKTSSLLAKLKQKYEKQGFLLPLADLLIATLVIENSMILVTKDKDFEKIEELTTIFI
jgi:predicted nucleic acid-binding protein